MSGNTDGNNADTHDLHNTLQHLEYEEGNDYSLRRFIDENYRLITTSGLFAAIAVYLTQLTQQSASEIQYGIGGCLTVFLLLLAVVLRNGTLLAGSAVNEREYVNFFSILTILVGMGALGYSVYSVAIRYSEEITPILDFTLVIGGTLVYLIYLYRESKINNPSSEVEELYEYTPILSAFVVLYEFPIEEMVNNSGLGELYSLFIPIIGAHFVGVSILNIAVAVLDSIVRRRS